MKKVFIPFFSFGLSLLWTSCTLKEEAPSDALSIQKGTELTVTATISNESDAKTLLQPDLSIFWTPGDDINLFYSNKTYGHFTTPIESPAATADFLGYLIDDVETIGPVASSRPYWGVYPYDPSNICDGEGVTLTIPSSQASTEGSFANKLNPAVANSSSPTLQFYNVCAPFYFSVTQEGVNSLTFRGNDNEDVAGKVKVSMDAAGKPVASVIDGQKSIIIWAPGASKGGYFIPGQTYLLVLLPQTLSSGYTLTLRKGAMTAECVVSKSAVFQRALGRSKMGVDEGLTYTTSAFNLSVNGSANSYVVSSEGAYAFPAVKGNSSEPVGNVASTEVLWESFGTDVEPSAGDIIAGVECRSDSILFVTPQTLKNGNAVIAAKDANGVILWSWHIWVCKDFDPVATEQEYYNDAGTMMDRNLGAISATPGDFGALGLMYQWGRKDPFLGGYQISYSSYSHQAKAASTLSWPSPVTSNSSKGKIDYAVKNPTTFIKSNSNNSDWYYTGSSSTDNNRWQSTKTLYDPCPPGWRVPDGDRYGVWSKATSVTSGTFSYLWDSTNKGMNLGGKLGSAAIIWYSATGFLNGADADLYYVGYDGVSWSITPDGLCAYSLNLNYNGYVYPSISHARAGGNSVRCQKDVPTPDPAPVVTRIDLSATESANCYVVSSAGAYKFKGNVKGNSYTLLDGTPVKAELLWETFGTNVTPNVNDVIASVSYKDGYVEFETPATLKNGNAVIAAKDADDNILWSWHIWVCKDFDPVATGQVYYNDAGTMMDRNLGAISATPGDVGALGLLYQWGRKDPFLSGGSISSTTKAKSTLGTWPSPESSDSSTGTVAYAVAHPTTFINGVSDTDDDWVFSSRDNTLWKSVKTIYDPCPPGWKVPAGGSSGVWSKAANTSSGFSHTWDSTNKGMNFSGNFGSAGTVWYPAAGYLSGADGSLYGVGSGTWWSCTPYTYRAYYLHLDGSDDVDLSYYYSRAFGFSVRCLQE